MNRRGHNARIAVFSVFAYFATISAQGQITASTTHPNPPPQICVNGVCATTTAAAATPSPAGSRRIKWNPGHYMGSNSVQGRGDTGPADPWEFKAMLNSPPQIVGYKAIFYWNALEADTPGVYTFALLDSMLAQLTAAGKRLVLVVLPGYFSGFAPPPIPGYILNDPGTYGAAPSGPWGTTGGWWGSATSGNSAAFHRTAVNNRWIALFRALGARYESNPNFEAIMLQEDAYFIGAVKGAPDFDQSTWVANLETMLSATAAAFPTTNVAEENSWLITATPTQQLEDWMMQNRIAAAEADAAGQSYISSHGGAAAALPWGVAAYLGVQVSDSSYAPMRDWHAIMPYFADVEAPDLGVYGNPAYAWPPQDLLNALNQTYHATHAFWDYLPSSATSNSAVWWSNLQSFLASNPLSNTGYPAGYPAN